jgi:ribosome-binding factor A
MMQKRDGKGRAGQAPSQRQLRVGEELRHVLADILGRGEFRDPALQDRVITVTEVRISPDLHNATAFVVPLGGQDTETILPALRRVGPYLRTLIGHRVRLRTVPNLFFELDSSFDYAQRIDGLLHSPLVRRDIDADDESSDDETETD